MNTLLLQFIALPIATIILSIVLLKILKCPALVAATFFSIYLILTYAIFGSDFLILAILYTILSYITAFVTKILCSIIEKINRCSNIRSGENNNCNNTSQDANLTKAQFTVTTNQSNPVLCIGNGNARTVRNNCCCCRKN